VRKISKVRIEHHSWNRRADGVRSLILDTLVSLSEKPPLLKVVGARHPLSSANHKSSDKKTFSLKIIGQG